MGIFWDFESFANAPALIADTGAVLTYRDLESLSGDMEAGIREHADRDNASGPLVMFVCRNRTSFFSVAPVDLYPAFDYDEKNCQMHPVLRIKK